MNFLLVNKDYGPACIFIDILSHVGVIVLYM